jgi:hypothetical protein
MGGRHFGVGDAVPIRQVRLRRLRENWRCIFNACCRRLQVSVSDPSKRHRWLRSHSAASGQLKGVSRSTIINCAAQLKTRQMTRQSNQPNRAVALSRSALAATMRCIISMNNACSLSVKSPSVARWASRADVSILARTAAPAAVNRQSRARRSSPLTALSTKLRAARRFSAPVVVVLSSAISAANVVWSAVCRAASAESRLYCSGVTSNSPHAS